ncbi:probable aminoacyl tRNA synthase complex-interacting multifunctional protein 2 isoform X2 [Belonocnema kinseyi]|uniref:probable aminoacyl tRNA synthase complex-interacting multifunctional protein 2 isoform X2 n=1 Tax=Belonocnema kinseyi TaxID=2817044 RepID=UPI00143CE4BB|nr:probable aminoacyl tRNA synthase complex-interacting multifunctional protein 2 isoform X2 [Belonocnema kinseyi]
MSGPTTMYALKPIITLPSSLKSKNVMYEMKSIHEAHQLNGNHSPLEDSIVSQVKDQVTFFLKEPNPDLTLLENRQEKILSQLAELKQQIAHLFVVLKSTNCSKSSVEDVSKPVNVDIILTANPKKAPYSILALTTLWSDSSFRIQTHVHSTITGTVPEFAIQKDENNTQKNVINLRLIWKDVSDLELKSELSTCPISGEVNFLRYLSRLIQSHNYENADPVETNLIDSILDLCHMLSHQSPREAQATISILGDHLTNGPWFLNKKDPSLVDIAAWSLIKRLNSKLPSSLAKWFQNCEKTFL